MSTPRAEMWTPLSRASGPAGVPQAPRVIGSLALAPGGRHVTAVAPLPEVRPRTDPAPASRRPGHPYRLRGARRHPGAGRPATKSASVAIRGDGSSGRTTLVLRLTAEAQAPARSWPGSTCRAASTRSRRSPAVSGSNGWWSSPRRRSTRASPSVARCWPGARSTCSSWTCPVAGWPPRIVRPASPTGSAGWRRSPGARRRSSSCSNRPVTPAA